jgi:hypothetical protein
LAAEDVTGSSETRAAHCIAGDRILSQWRKGERASPAIHVHNAAGAVPRVFTSGI